MDDEKEEEKINAKRHLKPAKTITATVGRPSLLGRVLVLAVEPLLVILQRVEDKDPLLLDLLEDLHQPGARALGVSRCDLWAGRMP